jgi:hypothetical protein
MTFRLFEEGGAKRNAEHLCFGECFLFSKIKPYGNICQYELTEEIVHFY